jgi:hypothetical protein
MTEPSTPSADDRIYAALDANCDALMALELSCALARSGADIGEFSVPAAKAIEALRRAIDELRRAVGEESPAGFVLPDQTRGDHRGSVEPGDDRGSVELGSQAKPRRTA